MDDPFAFGAIAAANALSDVYAMGGRPLTALSIAAFPERDFPLEWAQAIVRGGSEALARAGCALIGGHSVRDPEIKFGYAVTGLVDPARMLTNAAGQPGQALVLTKPLGTGVIATALKAGKAPEASVLASTAVDAAAQPRGRRGGARPRRHRRRPTSPASGSPATPPGSRARAASRSRSSSSRCRCCRGRSSSPSSSRRAGLKANRQAFEPRVEYGGRAEEARKALLYDPQTSGGLLLLVPEAEVPALFARVAGRARRGPGPQRGRASARREVLKRSPLFDRLEKAVLFCHRLCRGDPETPARPAPWTQDQTQASAPRGRTRRAPRA